MERLKNTHSFLSALTAILEEECCTSPTVSRKQPESAIDIGGLCPDISECDAGSKNLLLNYCI